MAATTSLAPQARARQPSVPAHSQPSIALEQIIAPIRIAPGSKLSRFSNWGGTFHAVPERVYQPVTVEQCLALVELARREGAELRPVGRAHSPSDLPFTKGWVMRMEGLEGLLEVSAWESFEQKAVCRTVAL